MSKSKEVFIQQRDVETENPFALSERQTLLIQGKLCPYCMKPSELTDSVRVYNDNQNPRPMWACFPCQAWVGCHKDTTESLGRLANSELRMHKKLAHEAFDPIWKNRHMYRNEAYHWLAVELGVPKAFTYIEIFSVETCKRVIEASKKYLADK